MDLGYESSKSLPNKWLNPDGSITDGQGNIISPASASMASVYKSSKSIVNKFIDVDGETKTYAEISLDLFVPVDELPETGEKNKIYLVPAGNGMFDEYYWNQNEKWDILGSASIDLADYPTITQMNDAIQKAVYDALGGDY
jgi:hypothetical protein